MSQKKAIQKLDGSTTTEGKPPGARQTDQEAGAAGGVIIGRLVGLEPDGRAFVAIGERGGLERVLTARVLGALEARVVGGAVALMFEGGRTDRPIVLGPVLGRSAAEASLAGAAPGRGGDLALEFDGRRVVLTAHEEVVLRCGPASIKLTSDGRVAIRGVKVLSRASGVNKVRGGSVQIN